MGPNFSGLNRFRSKSSNNNYYVANNYPTNAASEPKSKTKILIIVVISAVVLITIFAIIGNLRNKDNKKEVVAEAPTLIETYGKYVDFVSSYRDCIGFTPSVSHNGTELLGACANELEESLTNLKSKFNEEKEKNEQYEGFDKIEKNLSENIPIFETNVSKTENFYVAFREYIDESISQWSCNKTQKLSDLEKSDDEHLKNAAQLYENYFCEITTNYTEEEFDFEAYYNENLSTLDEIEKELNRSLKKAEDIKIEELFVKLENSDE